MEEISLFGFDESFPIKEALSEQFEEDFNLETASIWCNNYEYDTLFEELDINGHDFEGFIQATGQITDKDDEVKFFWQAKHGSHTGTNMKSMSLSGVKIYTGSVDDWLLEKAREEANEKIPSHMITAFDEHRICLGFGFWRYANRISI